jgi:hypothetical protein
MAAVEGALAAYTAANSGGNLSLTTTPLSPYAAWTLTQGDTVVIITFIRSITASANIPAGFTDISGLVRAGTIPATIRIFARTWNTGDPTAWTVTFTGGAAGTVGIANVAFFRNTDITALALSGISSTTAGPINHSIQAVGAFGANDMYIHIAGQADDGTAMTEGGRRNTGGTWVNDFSFTSAGPKSQFATTLGNDARLMTSMSFINVSSPQTSDFYGFFVGEDSGGDGQFPFGLVQITLVAKEYFPANSFPFTASGALRLGGIAATEYNPGGSTSFPFTASGALRLGGQAIAGLNQKTLYGLNFAWSAAALEQYSLSGQFYLCQIAGVLRPMTFLSITRRENSAQITLTVVGKLFNIVGATLALSVIYRFAGLPEISKSLISGGVTISSARISPEGLTTIDAVSSAESYRYSEWLPKRVQYRNSTRVRGDVDWDVRPQDVYLGSLITRVTTVTQLGNISFTEISYGQS